VVIPARNEAAYIRGALESVSGQTAALDELEAVVVDNGSTDATCDVVERFRSEHSHPAVTLVHHDPPGVAGAKNCGARVAQGSVLLFLDADSRMASDLAQRIAEREAAGWAAASVRIVADSADLLDRAFFELIEFGKVRFNIRAQMFYCARDAFVRLGGFDERLRVAEDRDFILRLQRSGTTVCHLSESYIATSPRRLRRLPARLGMLTMLTRWALANKGIGRQWRY
jgi:glycosyltransferase involved in cell wall biosynthesis